MVSVYFSSACEWRADCHVHLATELRYVHMPLTLAECLVMQCGLNLKTTTGCGAHPASSTTVNVKTCGTSVPGVQLH